VFRSGSEVISQARPSCVGDRNDETPFAHLDGLLGTEDDVGMKAPPLIGREREIRVLEELIVGANTRGGVLIVRGEAGIGKSSLLAEASRLARDGGMSVFMATGVQSEAHLAFAGLHQLIQPILLGVEVSGGSNPPKFQTS